MITKTRLLIIGMILVSYPMAASSTFANSEGIETSDIFSSFKEWTSERMQHATPLGISNNSYKITRPVWHQTFGPYFSSSRLIPASANVVYPYSTVGKLFFSIPGRGDFYCSASVISYRIVLTAGHCLHDGSGTKNGFYTNFSFVPAYQNGVAPFLAWRGSYAAVTKAWFYSNGVLPNGADYGMLEVKDRSSGTPRRLGSDTGFLGFKINVLRFNHAHILGYPLNIDSGEQMHQVTSESAGAVPQHTILYPSDMREGSDGGPLIENFGKASLGEPAATNDDRNSVIGVTSFFPGNGNSLIESSSIPDDRFTNLFNKVCAHRAGNCS